MAEEKKSSEPVEPPSSSASPPPSSSSEQPRPVQEPGQPLTDREARPADAAGQNREGSGNGDGSRDGDGNGQGGREDDRLAQPVDDELPPRLAFPVVGIGGSAGGIEAFIEFFGAMPGDAGLAFVVIQHLPPERPSLMADILAKHTRMTVREAAEGLTVEPDHVYVIHPGRTTTLRDGRLHLSRPAERRGYERPVDDFFRSLAAEQRERAVCVSMSGMGSDGAAGAQAVKAVGGVCIAQDPDSAKFPHMPRALIDAGLADFVLPPAQIPDVLVGYARHPYARGRATADDLLRGGRPAYDEILSILRARTRRDFSGYKRPTVVRRIQRRMGLSRITDVAEYARALRQHATEATALADDLFIHVTGFFRDAAAWEALRTQVIRPLVAQRAGAADMSVRAWVTACSSGEEAYTLAILLLEEAAAADKPLDIKVFATDMAERSLATARAGLFPVGIEGEVPPERLERFFVREAAGYRIRREVRERVIFAPQDVLQDPPFSRLDLVTCRNLLIYLEPPMQERVLRLMHFGLREGGALFLGTSETVGTLGPLFEPLDKKWRIYRRVGPSRPGTLSLAGSSRQAGPGFDGGREGRAGDARGEIGSGGGGGGGGVGASRMSVAIAAQRALLERHAPATVVVDRDYRILYYHGHTERFLVQPTGEPTQDLFELARTEIRPATRQAVERAVAGNAPAEARTGWLATPNGGGRVRVAVTAAPLDPRMAEGLFLVSFVAHAGSGAAESPAGSAASAATATATATAAAADLAQAREELQSTIEDLQTSNEELKASNEEVTSVNEELQSANEELETGKEELQSLNEELSTVNAQLQHKTQELEQTTNDLSSLLASTDIAVLFLDTSFCIRRYTPAVMDLIEIRPADLGRPLSDLAPKFDDPKLLADAQMVLDRLVPVDREVPGQGGRWYLRRLLPYRTQDRRIDGVVITFLDITRLKGAERRLSEHEDEYRLIFESVHEYAIFTADTGGTIKTWSPGAERILGYTAREAVGSNCRMIFTPEDRLANEPEKERATALSTGRAMDDRWHVRKDGSRFWASGVMSLLKDEAGNVRGLVKVLRDNTDMKRAEQALQEAKRAAEAGSEAKDQFLATISHELRTPLSAILIWGGALRRALRGGSAPDAETLTEALEAIEHSAQAQKHLIEDLLDTARISSGQMRLNLRETNLTGVVRSAVSNIRPTAEAKGVRLNVDEVGESGVIRADPDRMEQVLWNLLSNAVKFTPAGGQVAVSLRRLEPEALEIRVADTGQGIPREFMPRLFDRFTQAESGVGGKGGLGLGLTIVRQLVELHGGGVEAISAGPGKGATFVVRLPLPEVGQEGGDVGKKTRKGKK